MGTYIQRDLPKTSLSWVLDPNNRASLSASTDTAATLTSSRGAQTGLIATFSFVTPASDPSLTNWDGNFSAGLDATEAGSSISYGGRWGWASSDLSSGNGIAHQQSEALFTGTGLRTATATGVSWGLRSATDRFVFTVSSSNSNMMSAEDITLRVNTTDSYVDVPWSVGEPPPTDTPRPAYIGGGYYG